MKYMLHESMVKTLFEVFFGNLPFRRLSNTPQLLSDFRTVSNHETKRSLVDILERSLFYLLINIGRL